jgi:hypothetical protein
LRFAADEGDKDPGMIGYLEARELADYLKVSTATAPSNGYGFLGGVRDDGIPAVSLGRDRENHREN